MDYCNSSEKEYCNIYSWQEKGYTGKGIIVGFVESMISDKTRPFIEIPFYPYNMKYSHGDRTIDVFHQIAPDSKVILLPKCPTKNIDGYDVDWIIKQGITLINVSQTGAWFTDEEINKLLDNNVKIIASAGNYGYKGKETPWLSDDKVLAVGAVHMENNKPQLADYSSWGLGYVDCVGFSHLYMSNYFDFDNNKSDGTSFSCPWVTGMLALYEQYFKDKYNKTPTSKQIRKFIYNNCQDLGEKGRDLKYGNGLFILPTDILNNDKKEIHIKKENINDRNYVVEVFGESDIGNKLNKKGYKCNLLFFDGCNFKIYEINKFKKAVDAVALRNKLIKQGFISKIKQV